MAVIWFILFGPLGALALWGLSRQKKWGMPLAVIAGFLMAIHAASLKSAKFTALTVAQLAAFAFFATDEHMKATPAAPETSEQYDAVGPRDDYYSPEAVRARAERTATMLRAVEEEVRLTSELMRERDPRW